jgi:hypothetical protein
MSDSRRWGKNPLPCQSMGIVEAKSKKKQKSPAEIFPDRAFY